MPPLPISKNGATGGPNLLRATFGVSQCPNRVSINCPGFSTRRPGQLMRLAKLQTPWLMESLEAKKLAEQREKDGRGMEGLEGCDFYGKGDLPLGLVQTCSMEALLKVGPSSVPAFCDSSVPAGIRSFLPAWWAQMSQIDGGPLCSKLHKCSTHKYCVGTDDLRCFGALQLLENILRNCHRCLLWVTCGTVRHLRVLYLCLLSVPCSSHVW